MSKFLSAALVICVALAVMIVPAQAEGVEGPGYSGEALAKLECTRHHLSYETRGDVGRAGVRVLHFLLGIGNRLGYTEWGQLPETPNTGEKFADDFDADDLNSLRIVTAHFNITKESAISHGTFAMIFLSQLGGSCRNTQNGGLPVGPCHPHYDPCLPVVDDMNCPDVRNRVTLRNPAQDEYNLDGDGDGVTCESFR